MSEKVSRKITIMQMAMSVLIVIYHGTFVYLLKTSFAGDFDGWFTFKTYRLYDLFAATALGMFFMISGVLHYINLDWNNLLCKMRKRLASLFLPFTVWNFVFFLFLWVRGEFSYYNLSHFIKLCTVDPFNGPLWYVFNLMVLVGLSPLILKLKRISPVYQAGLLLLLAVVCWRYSIIYWQKEVWVRLWFERTVRYLPHYFLGVFMAWNGKGIINQQYDVKAVRNLAFIIMIAIVFIQLKYGASEKEVISFVLNRTLPVAVWFSFPAVKSEKITALPLKMSFLLYVSHVMIMKVGSQWFVKAHEGIAFTGWQTTFIRLATVVVIYLIVLAFACTVNKISPKTYRLISGGRG